MESTKEAYKWTDAKIEENTYLTKDAAEKKRLQRRIGLIESKKSDLKNNK